MKAIFRTKDGKEFDYERDAIYHEKSLEKSTEINATQSLMFDLIKRASFNGFDGEQAVKFLIRNRDLWKGVTMGNEEYYTLRDIDEDSWHADTLKVLAVDENAAQTLKKKIKASLSPDEISIENLSSSAVGDQGTVVRAWWD
jgi:hypothetical protein